MKKLFSSLRFRLLLLVLLAVLPALGLILYTDLEERRLAAADIQADALLLTRFAAANQEQSIEGMRELLIALAHLPAVRNRDSTVCSALFANLLDHYPLYANLSAAAPNGDIFCSAVPSAQPVNSTDLAWFQRAVSTRDFVFGDYQIGRITGEPVIVAAYPVFDDSGNLQAIVTVPLDLARLSQLVAEVQLPPGSTFTMIDSNGTILAHYPEAEKWVGQTLPEASLVQTMLAQGEGTAEVAGVDGIPRLYAFTSLDGPQPGLYISIGIPKHVAYAEADRILTRNLILLGLTTALMLAVAWVGSDVAILRRARALVGATQRMTAGELNARTGLSYGHDELGWVAQAFDEMAETLEQREVERKRAEEDLSKAHQLLETIFDHTHMMVAYLDPRFDFIRVNRAYAQADEREPAFFPGKNHFALFPNAENEAIFRRVVETGKPHFALAKPFEYAEHLERGVSYWDWSLVPIKDPDGTVTGLILTLLNVTDRLWAEQALRESEAKFRSIYAQSPIGIELYDSEGRLIDANPACLAIFGVSDLDVVMGFDLFNDPNLPKEARIKLCNGEPVKFEAFFDFDLVKQEKLYETTKSGKCYLDCLITPLISGTSTINGYLVHVRDITARKQGEAALAEAEARLRTVLSNAPITIFALDDQGILTLSEGKGLERVGLKPGENVGVSAFDIYGSFPFVEETGEVIPGKDVIRSVLTGEAVTVISELHGVYFDNRMNPIRDADGKVVGVVGVATDITERKRAEEELAKSREQLRALSQYLQSAREEERSAVAREIHDELGQVLTALKMDLAWLAKHLPKGEDNLLEKTGAMSRLVDATIRTVRQIATELRPGLLDDLGLVAALEWQAGEFQKRMGIACELHLPEEIPGLDRDVSTAVFRIFQETLTNIARHAGATRVRVDLNNSPQGLTFIVRDNGQGITEDQVSDPKSLGLIGMRERLQQWDGKMTFAGAPGQGTTVTVRIPVSRPKEDEK